MIRTNKLYERIIAEKDRHIQILALEIDWLRAQLGRPSVAPALNPSELPPVDYSISDGGWESEEQEALKIMADQEISAALLPEVLDGLGYGLTL